MVQSMCLCYKGIEAYRIEASQAMQQHNFFHHFFFAGIIAAISSLTTSMLYTTAVAGYRYLAPSFSPCACVVGGQ